MEKDDSGSQSQMHGSLYLNSSLNSEKGVFFSSQNEFTLFAIFKVLFYFLGSRHEGITHT